MKRIKALTAGILFLICAFFFSQTALAAGAKLSLTADNSHVTAGDTVNITISVNASGADIDAFQASIGYDSSLLQYISGCGNDSYISGGSGVISGYGGEGIREILYTFSFRAYREGKASFKLSECEVISATNGKNLLSDTTSGITIEIAAKNSDVPSSPAASEDASPSPSPEPSDSTLYIEYDTAKYEAVDDDSLEGVLTKTTVYYKDTYYPGWSAADKSYILARAGNRLFLFDAETNTVLPLISLKSSSICLPAPLPEVEGYERVRIDINGVAVDMLKTDQEGFYLLLCTNVKGDIDWYYYDSSDGSLLAAAESTAPSPSSAPSLPSIVSTAEAETSSILGDINVTTVAVIAVGAFILILIIAVIVAASSRR